MTSLPFTWVIEQIDMADNAAGYTRANWSLRSALQKAGGVESYSAKLAIHMQTPYKFFRWFGRTNVMYTMWESENVPELFQPALRQADVIIVPSEWNRGVFRRYTDKPVYVSPLGVNLDVFQGVNRPEPLDRPFRWLWVGAPNPRKGHIEVTEAWDRGGFLMRDDCELYLKTSEDRRDIVTGANVTIDARLLSDLEMMQLYAEADGFLFPSTGEGWGLPLIEAMATALPCVTTLHTGMSAFANPGVCLPVGTYPTELRLNLDEGGTEIRDDLPRGKYEALVTAQKAHVDDIVRQMHWVMSHWRSAKALGIWAWRHVQQYSWLAAGRRLYQVLKEIEGSGQTCRSSQLAR